MDFLYDEKGTPFAFEYQGKMYFYQTNLQGRHHGELLTVKEARL